MRADEWEALAGKPKGKLRAPAWQPSYTKPVTIPPGIGGAHLGVDPWRPVAECTDAGGLVLHATTISKEHIGDFIRWLSETYP